jgi:hypothetical protein
MAKSIADRQLDMVFAVANAQKRSPVKVAAEGVLPKTGTTEAEEILGRGTAPIAVSSEGKKRFNNAGEAVHEEV